MKIKLTKMAEKQLRKIAKGDKKSAGMIYEKIKDYADGKGEHSVNVTKLSGNKERMRMRIGNYRIIFKIKNDMMLISIIKHRSEAYDD